MSRPRTRDAGIRSSRASSTSPDGSSPPSARATPQLLDEGKGDPEIAALMDHQHRTIVAAIRAGRFDGKLQGLKGPAAVAQLPPSCRATPRGTSLPKRHAQTLMQTGAVPAKRSRRRRSACRAGRFPAARGAAAARRAAGAVRARGPAGSRRDRRRPDPRPGHPRLPVDRGRTRAARARHGRPGGDPAGADQQPDAPRLLVEERPAACRASRSRSRCSRRWPIRAPCWSARPTMSARSRCVSTCPPSLAVRRALIISGSSDLGRAEIKQLL